MSDILNRAVVFAVDFKPRIVGGLQVMPNHGRAGGAPTWLQLGNGSTASTIPVPLAGYGASFTGTQYVDTGVVDRYERTDQFSLYWYGRYSDPSTGAADAAIMSIDQAQSFRGIGLMPGTRQTLERPRILIWSTLTTNALTANAASLPSNVAAAVCSICASYAGAPASVSIHFNGVSASVGLVNNSLSSSIKNGKSLLLGAWHNGANKARFFNSTSYAFGVFDGILTPRDIVTLDTLVRGGIR